jgi:prophage regulatory protein
MPTPDRIIRLKTVLARTGLSRSTLYRKIAEGTFPAQLRISIHGAGWRESDIDRWSTTRQDGGWNVRLADVPERSTALRSGRALSASFSQTNLSESRAGHSHRVQHVKQTLTLLLRTLR